MNPDALTVGSPALPAWALYPASALVTGIIIHVLIRTRNTPARFVIFACWSRYMLAAYHEITYAASPIGLSWNALASIAVFALGVAVLNKREIVNRFFFPVYLISALVVISGLLNFNPVGILNTVVKFGYFLVICLGVQQAMKSLGAPGFLKPLLWAFAPPLLFQLISVALGIGKAAENDGSASYIGGYNHEAAFSIILATCFVVACFVTQVGRWLKSVLVVLCLGGIFVANYRTTMLAMMPLIPYQFLRGIPTAFKRDQRQLISAVLTVLMILAMAGVVWVAQERFADIGVAYQQAGNLIKEPTSFTVEDRRLLSGRPFLWSQYIYAHKAGDTLQQLFGFGPDSWQTRFGSYAHNTLVSYLYELGLTGFAAIIFLWGWMLTKAFRIEVGPRGKIITAHISFILLNMATMPHWQIEGQILYGIICGYTFHWLRVSRAAARQSRSREFRPPEHSPEPVWDRQPA